GWLSTTGLVPACRTLDCISVFALTVNDALAVANLAGGYDPSDAYSRSNPNSARVGVFPQPRLAYPIDPEFFGDEASQLVFAQTDRKSTRLNSSHEKTSYAVFGMKHTKDRA